MIIIAGWGIFCLNQVGAVGTLLAESYSSPYQVRQREEKILLQLGDRQELVSANRLKPHLGEAPVPAQPL